MTPDDAEEIMRPFYPYDSNLAIKALKQAFNKELDTPEWVIDSILKSYFTFLKLKDLEKELDQIIKTNVDPFGFNTVPYIISNNKKDYN